MPGTPVSVMGWCCGSQERERGHAGKIEDNCQWQEFFLLKSYFWFLFLCRHVHNCVKSVKENSGWLVESLKKKGLVWLNWYVIASYVHSSSLLSSMTSWMSFSAALSAFSELSLFSPYLEPLQQPSSPHFWPTFIMTIIIIGKSWGPYITICPQELRR